MRHRRCVRTARCPRTPASGLAASRSAPPAPPSCARSATSARRPAGRRASRAAPETCRSPWCAELVQEGIRLELAAERGLPAVARVDDGVGPEALDERGDRVQQGLPIAARQVDTADRVLEEEIAGEEPAVDEVGDVP